MPARHILALSVALFGLVWMLWRYVESMQLTLPEVSPRPRTSTSSGTLLAERQDDTPRVVASDNLTSSGQTSYRASSTDTPVLSETHGRQSSLHIVCNANRLSAAIENRLLDQVLAEIQNRCGIAIVADGVEGRPISAQFRDLPLSEGLRIILQDYDVFLYFNADAHGVSAVQTVWVYPKNQGWAIMPVPAEQWASTTELEAGLISPDPDARARAIEGLIKRDPSGSLDRVLKGLTDKDDEVRSRVLYQALEGDVVLPSDTLIHLALNDPMTEVRFMALQAMAKAGTALAPGAPSGDANDLQALVKRMMSSDPSPEVRNEAKAIAKRLAKKTVGTTTNEGLIQEPQTALVQ